MTSVPGARLHARAGRSHGEALLAPRGRGDGDRHVDVRSRSSKARARWSAGERSRATRRSTEASLARARRLVPRARRTRKRTSRRSATGSISSTATAATTSVVVTIRADARRERHAGRRLFTITEGPQIIVDHVIIIGNHRTSTATIERELLLQSRASRSAMRRGREPAAAQARSACSAACTITSCARGEPRRDVLVQVGKSPPTDDRRTAAASKADTRCGRPARPASPRNGSSSRRAGSSRSARRNLWGKNRTDRTCSPASASAPARHRGRMQRLTPPQPIEERYGFNEYRVLGHVPRAERVRHRADLLVTGILEQAIRSELQLRRREARSRGGLPSVADRYSVSRPLLVPAHQAVRHQSVHADAEKPLIDRLFPAGAAVEVLGLADPRQRTIRDDLLDPDPRHSRRCDTDLAARAIGSEVGFVQDVSAGLQLLPAAGRRGAWCWRSAPGSGWRTASPGCQRRVDSRLPTSGTIGLPASERFFAGGDTTVRGFSLDRLGNERRSADGIPDGRQRRGRAEQRTARRSHSGHCRRRRSSTPATCSCTRATSTSPTCVPPPASASCYRSPRRPIRVDLGLQSRSRRSFVPDASSGAGSCTFLLGQPF